MRVAVETSPTVVPREAAAPYTATSDAPSVVVIVAAAAGATAVVACLAQPLVGEAEAAAAPRP